MRRPDADRRLLVARHGAVVAPGLHLLVAEILDRLEIEERVDRLGMGVLVGLVHRPADLDAPVGHLHREPDIGDHRHRDDEEVGPVELPGDHRRGEQELEEGRDRVEDGEADDGLDAGDAALDDAGQAAGPPLQVVAERQPVHVDEALVGELADRVLADLGEQRVAKVVEDVHQDAADAVGDDQHDRHEQRAADADRQAAVRPSGRVDKRVGRPFVGVGNEDGDDLGRDQDDERDDHAPLQVRPVRRPHVGPEVDQSAERRLRLDLRLRRSSAFRDRRHYAAPAIAGAAARPPIASATAASAAGSMQ